MSEPDWKLALMGWVVVAVGGTAHAQAYALETLLPHIEAAYQRGLMAGRSQAGYTTRRKKREDSPCAPSAASPSPASTTEGEG